MFDGVGEDLSAAFAVGTGVLLGADDDGRDGCIAGRR